MLWRVSLWTMYSLTLSKESGHLYLIDTVRFNKKIQTRRLFWRCLLFDYPYLRKSKTEKHKIIFTMPKKKKSLCCQVHIFSSSRLYIFFRYGLDRVIQQSWTIIDALTPQVFQQTSWVSVSKVCQRKIM